MQQSLTYIFIYLYKMRLVAENGWLVSFIYLETLLFNLHTI